MVSLSLVRAANARITALTYATTAVFVGGTSGIGRATLVELARRKTTGLKVYIIGRSAAASEGLMSQLRSINPKGDFIFLEAQVSLLSDVKRVTDEIKARETSLDLLWLSMGALPFDGRKGWTNLVPNAPMAVTRLLTLDIRNVRRSLLACNPRLLEPHAVHSTTPPSLEGFFSPPPRRLDPPRRSGACRSRPR